MSNLNNQSSNRNNMGLSDIGLSTSKSEDIQILDRRILKYLQLQSEVRNVISANVKDKDDLVNDIVDAIFNLNVSPTWWNFITLGIVPIKNHLKRKKIRKVIENILYKIFDITLGWYAMDYEDLKETCDYIGGKDYFSTEDHKAIYIAVIHKLKQGPIRDKCIQLGLANFVNEKLIDIRNNYLLFKIMP